MTYTSLIPTLLLRFTPLRGHVSVPLSRREKGFSSLSLQERGEGLSGFHPSSIMKRSICTDLGTAAARIIVVCVRAGEYGRFLKP